MDKGIEIYEAKAGEKVVILDDVRFKGKTREEWDEIEELLKQYVGQHQEILETCDVIYIGKDFPDEFAHGEDKIKLMKSNAKAKANASSAVKQLIQIASNKSFKEDYEKKHGKHAQNGWYRYDTRLAIPIYDNYNEILRYNIYKLRMLVRHDADGKLYLYDFVHAKKEKETSSPLCLTRTVENPFLR